MTPVNLLDFERDPLLFLRRVEAGETLFLLRDEQPVAEIKPIHPSPAQECEPITADTEHPLTIGQMADALGKIAKKSPSKDIPLGVDPDDFPLD